MSVSCDCIPVEAIDEVTAWLTLPDVVRAALHDVAVRFAHDEARTGEWSRRYQRWIASGPDYIEEALDWPRATRPDDLATYALLCLAGVANGRALLMARGLPDAIVRATFLDIERQLQRCCRVHGCWGIEQPRWLGRHLHGRIVEVGRLQYELGTIAAKTAATADASLAAALTQHRLTMDTPVWWVHIPGGSPLLSVACDASFAEARPLLATHFAEHRAAWFACRSWMLDTQLRRYLPASANLLRFQSRFNVIHEQADDGEFDRHVRSEAGAGRTSQLLRADEAIRQSGGTWRTSLGVARIQAY